MYVLPVLLGKSIRSPGQPRCQVVILAWSQGSCGLRSSLPRWDVQLLVYYVLLKKERKQVSRLIQSTVSLLLLHTNDSDVTFTPGSTSINRRRDMSGLVHFSQVGRGLLSVSLFL